MFVNAGVGAYGPILDLPAEHLDEMIEVNVKGANIMFPGRNVAAMADRGKDGKVDKGEWEAFVSAFTSIDHALMRPPATDAWSSSTWVRLAIASSVVCR